MTTTAWSGFWGDGVGSSGMYTELVNKMPRRNDIRRVVNREGFRAFTALFNGLIGAATGSNVTATHSRRSASVQVGNGPSHGGAIAIDTITDINRTTGTADVTALKEMTYNVTTRPSYPVDLSGNGGKAFT